jgi:hypothetical protein
VLALTFVLKNSPSFQHIDNLQGELVKVPFSRGVSAFFGANNMHDGCIVGGLSDAKVAVLRVLAQPIELESAIACVLDAEGHGFLLG